MIALTIEISNGKISGWNVPLDRQLRGKAGTTVEVQTRFTKDGKPYALLPGNTGDVIIRTRYTGVLLSLSSGWSVTTDSIGSIYHTTLALGTDPITTELGTNKLLPAKIEVSWAEPGFDERSVTYPFEITPPERTGTESSPQPAVPTYPSASAVWQVITDLGTHIANFLNPHQVTKAQVGLGNCDNTSDVNKPISTAAQAAMNLLAPLSSPALTGTPTAPTAARGTNTTQIATMAALQAALGYYLQLTGGTLTGGLTAPGISISADSSGNGLRITNTSAPSGSRNWQLSPNGSSLVLYRCHDDWSSPTQVVSFDATAGNIGLNPFFQLVNDPILGGIVTVLTGTSVVAQSPDGIQPQQVWDTSAGKPILQSTGGGLQLGSSVSGGQSLGSVASDAATLAAFQKWLNIQTNAASTVPSAATVDLGAVSGDFVTITGATTITSFGSSAPTGCVKFVNFTSSGLVLQYGATSIVLPEVTNFTTKINDVLCFRHLGSGKWILQGGSHIPGSYPLFSPGAQMSSTVTYGYCLGLAGFVTGQQAAVFGQGGTAAGLRSISMGAYNCTAGTSSFALGYQISASGDYSAVFGNAANTGSGIYSVSVSGSTVTVVKDMRGSSPASWRNSFRIGDTVIFFGGTDGSGNFYATGGTGIDTATVAGVTDTTLTFVGVPTSFTACMIANISRGMGAVAKANGCFVNPGDAQAISYVARILTSDATPTVLTLDGTTLDQSNRFRVPYGHTFAVTARIAGTSTSGADSAYYVRQFIIKNVADTTSIVGSVQTVGTDIESNAAWDVSIAANDSDDSLEISVTGAAATAIHWVATVECIEIGQP